MSPIKKGNMKTNLIIGASSGIGLALARQLLAKGERVISISRNQPAIEGIEHYFYDVLSSEPFPELQTPLDSIVYCPGSINLRPFRALKPADFLQELQLNVMGAINCIQKYYANLSASDNASILMFSTVAVQTGMPFHASIAASKGAIEGLTRSLAAEFAPKVRVNCIAPSLTNTPLADKLTNTQAKLDVATIRHPLKKIGDPEQVAAMAAFLLSAEASFITGQIIHIDGGMSAVRL